MKPSIPRPPMTQKERATALQEKRVPARGVGHVRKIVPPVVTKRIVSTMTAPNGRISYSHVQRKRT